MHIIILAGGFATRLWPLTEKVAKPLIPVAGKPLLNYTIEKLPESYPVIISTNQVFQKDFCEWKAEYFPQRNITIFTEDSLNESGKKGALSATAWCIQENNIEGDFVLLAGDNYFGFSFEAFFALADSHEPTIAVFDIKQKEEAKKFGVVVPLDAEYIQSFQEKPEHPSSCLVSTGAYIFPAVVREKLIAFSEKNNDDLGGVFEYFLDQGIKVRYFSFTERWYDIGSFPAFMEANNQLLHGKPCIDKTLIKDEQTEIVGSCVIEKNVVLENVFLENTVVRSGTTLKNVDVRNSIVGKNCFIEESDIGGKMIRDETIIFH